MREICLDTETTGLNPFEGHKIVEIGCVEMINGVKTGNNYHQYINPRRPMPEAAFRVHGISDEFLEDKPIFAHIAKDFLDYIKDAKLIIHNAKFDMKFLNFELDLINEKPLSFDNVVDSLLVARNKFPGAKNNLDALCKRFEVDLTKRTLHGALLDSELLADVYIELMGGAQKGLQLSDDNKEVDQVDITVDKKIIPSRNYELSQDQLNLHKEFISQNLKESLWGY